ncbi:MAG: transporter substrate-binding domain-containing protein [Deltaproteobacteria bacterium]|nr:transporter substrate-binding domain-containing protein [Deltaproteobacteria bacterium]
MSVSKSSIILIFFGLLGLAPAVKAAEIKVYGGNFPPYSGILDGRPFGIAVDILTAVTRAGGPKFIYDFSVSWARAQTQVLSDPNTLIIPFTKTSYREKQYKWVAPLFSYNIHFITIGRHEPVQTVEEAKNLRIGVVNGVPSYHLLRKLGFKNLDPVLSEEINMRKLELGRIDAWVVSDYIDKYVCSKLGWDVSKLQKGVNIGDVNMFYIASGHDFPKKVSDQMAGIVERLQKSGEIEKILNKYR